jgi:type III pantothenate kinase
MSQPIIAVDIGNTTVRLGLTQLVGHWPTDWSRVSELSTIETEFARLEVWLPQGELAWYVASVHRPCESRLSKWIRQRRPTDSYHRCSYEHLPLNINVPTPNRVGMDRLVAAVAADQLRDPGRPAIIVDAGTALKVDLVDADGSFQGGAILPGLGMAARALAANTDLLPHVDWQLLQEPPPAVGKGTELAIRSGLFYGCVGSIVELIRRYREELSAEPQVFTTGGDGQRVTQFISSDAVFVEDLALQGLVATAMRWTQ